MYQNTKIKAQINAHPIENKVVRFRKLGRQQQHDVVPLLLDVSGGVGLIEILNIRTMKATVLINNSETPEIHDRYKTFNLCHYKILIV